MTMSEIGDDSVWLNPLFDEGWPDTTEHLDHPLLGKRVRITIAEAGEPVPDADFFDNDPPRLKRDIAITGVLEVLEASGVATFRHDDGTKDWIPFAAKIEAAPMRWWHWRRLRWRAAADAAFLLPVAVITASFLVLWSAGWSIGTAAVGAGLASAPWALVGGQLVPKYLAKERALR